MLITFIQDPKVNLVEILAIEVVLANLKIVFPLFAHLPQLRLRPTVNNVE